MRLNLPAHAEALGKMRQHKLLNVPVFHLLRVSILILAHHITSNEPRDTARSRSRLAHFKDFCLDRLLAGYGMIGMIWVPKGYGIYISINIHIQGTFANESVCFCYACHQPQQPYKGLHKGGVRRRRPAATLCDGGRRPPPLHGGWAGGKHSKNIKRINKYALNMYIDAYISHIPLDALSSQSPHTQ